MRTSLKGDHASALRSDMTADEGLRRALPASDIAGAVVDRRLEQLERLNDWLLSLSRVEFCQLVLAIALLVDVPVFWILSLLACCPACTPFDPRSVPW
jgi:hypothetical protein